MSDEEHIIRDDEGREHRVKWAARTDLVFHDVAELLGTTTDLIMAANHVGRTVMALYTPGYPDDHTVWIASIRINADGTLRLIGRERSGMDWNDFESQIKARLEERFGPPETFTCPRCGMTSAHPEDVRQGYCGNCHDWTGDVPAG
jgi:hypothetical protein